MASHATAFSAAYTPLWLQQHVLGMERVEHIQQNKGKSTKNTTGWPFTMYHGSMRQGSAGVSLAFLYKFSNK